jgi:DNA invertase Pin-like site-specific DNA recombinase
LQACAPATYPHTKAREGTKGRQMTKDGTTKDPAAKAAAIALLSKGLASQAEVARLAGVSRQLMRHWAMDIPVEANRNAVLSKVWRRHIKKRH